MKRIVSFWPFIFCFFLAATLIYNGCGGGGGDSAPTAQPTVPAAATKMETELQTTMLKGLPWMSNIESGLVFVLNSADGITVAPDPIQPNKFTFNGSYDGNGDGYKETTISGSATFNTDPTIGWSGASGQAVVDIAIPVLGHIYHGDLSFTILSDSRQISGSWAFTDPASGSKTTMIVSSPLTIKDADLGSGVVSNACGYNLSGQVRVDVTGPDGSMSSNWNFTPTSGSALVNGISYTDSSGKVAAMPDSDVELVCGASGSITDWVGTFNQYWACLPYESGQATITIGVSGAGTITINDEDPPGSGINKNYQASLIGANNYAVRGYFNGGSVGSQYREDFNWSLRRNLSGFSQVSRYTYTDGPSIGQGGICAARGIRR